MTDALRLSDLVGLPPSSPWSDGDNIPWSEPAFSERMLLEHLSQSHDAASRRFATIDAQVDWIHDHVLEGRATSVLDLACGPGLYAARLARLGHRCLGIDYSPASIAYARQQAVAEALRCDYRCEDMRAADFGAGFGLVMLIFGEFNVFRASDAKSILTKAKAALADDGVLLLEPHTFDAVRAMAARPRHWYAAEQGLFSGDPHLLLQEQHWDAPARATTRRYALVDVATCAVRIHGQTFQAYEDADYRALLRESGFASVEFHPSLTGVGEDADPGLFVIVARA